MRLLKYAILGLINREPITGYDISKEFDRGLVNFWYATHSQIYPELRKLTEEGLVTFEIDTRGDRQEKKRYLITEKGKRELRKWLTEFDDVGPTPKDVFRLKLYYLNEIEKDTVLAHLRDQIQKRSRKLKRLERSLAENQRKSESYGKAYNREIGDYLVLYGAIVRERGYIDWIQYCADYLTKIS
jgi:DNA-binding PadR family transcriptional regulator